MIDVNQYLKGASPYNNAYALKYNDGDYSLEAKPPVVPESSNDIQHTVKDGETLQILLSGIMVILVSGT